MKKWILIIALLAVAFAAGILAGRGRNTPDIVEIRDTLTFHDTLFIDRPVPVYVSQIRTDTVRLAMVDSSHTTLTRDSATVAVPITRKVYEDSTYRAVISGYKPNLDSLWIYNTIREITITRTVKKPPRHWGFAVTAGPSLLVTPRGDVKCGLGVTAGLTYTF